MNVNTISIVGVFIYLTHQVFTEVYSNAVL